MTNEVLFQALAGHPFLSGIDQPYVRRLVRHATWASYDANELVLRYGQSANYCCLLVSGKFSVELYDPRRGPLVLNELSGPSVSGWSWLIPPYHWCFDARAVVDSQAILLGAEPLRNLMDESSEFGYIILQRCAEVFASRIRSARLSVLNLIQQET